MSPATSCAGSQAPEAFSYGTGLPYLILPLLSVVQSSLSLTWAYTRSCDDLRSTPVDIPLTTFLIQSAGIGSSLHGTAPHRYAHGRPAGQAPMSVRRVCQIRGRTVQQAGNVVPPHPAFDALLGLRSVFAPRRLWLAPPTRVTRGGHGHLTHPSTPSIGLRTSRARQHSVQEHGCSRTDTPSLVWVSRSHLLLPWILILDAPLWFKPEALRWLSAGYRAFPLRSLAAESQISAR